MPSSCRFPTTASRRSYRSIRCTISTAANASLRSEKSSDWRRGAPSCRSTPIAPLSKRRCSRNGCSPPSSMIIRTAGSPCSEKPATPAIITGPSSNDLLRNPREGDPLQRFHAQCSCYVLARPNEAQTGRRTMNKMIRRNTFDIQAAKERCLRYRRRILDISQQVGALHIGSAYSCTEIVDCMYHALMRRNLDGSSADTFLMSKGHGCMIQYVILEEAG